MDKICAKIDPERPEFFQVSWGRFSSHDICVASERGRGEEKGRDGKKKGGGEEKHNVLTMLLLVLKTFPSSLKMRGSQEKKGKREERKGKGTKKAGHGREENIFKGAGEAFLFLA